MNSRFGIKDFFLFLLVGALIISVWLMMRQQDRMWEKSRDLLKKVETIEGQVSQLGDKIDKKTMTVVSVATQHADGQPKTQVTGDQSWAKPGVKIEWQSAPGYGSDPRTQPGYKPGGEYTEVWEAQFPKVTPYISSDTYSRRVQDLVLESLADYDPVTLELQGLLAEAWQLDPDGLWLRAHLREGVRFSDGTPITAEDFRWTYHEYVMNEQIEAERSRSFYRDSIKEVKAIDDRTIEFTFYEPLFTNVQNALGLNPLPKHVYTKLSPAQINRSTGLLMGTGPYRVRDFDIDQQWSPPADMVLERNEQYWGEKPAFKVIRFKAIQDELPRLNAFKKGDADMITPAAPQFVAMQEDPEWKGKAQYLKWVNMRSGYSFIGWNCGKRNGKLTPFHDVRVRTAMTHLIDREKMIQTIWKGIGIVAKSSQNPYGPGSDPNIKPLPYDVKEALRLLKEAGWDDRNNDGVLEDASGNPFEYELSYSGGSEIAEKIVRFVVDSGAAVGIKVTLRAADWSVYQDFMKTRDFDAITLGWGSSAPETDPKQILHSDSIKNQGDNFVQWNCPEADRLIEAGRRELDTEKRMKIWQQLEAVQHKEQAYTFVRVPPWLRVCSPEVANVKTYFTGLEHEEFFRIGPSQTNTGQ